MRRLIGALSLVAVTWAGMASAAPGPLDPAHIAAIDKAAAAFLAIAKDTHKTGTPPRQSDPQIKKLLTTVCDTRGLNDGAAAPFAQIDALNDWLKQLTQIGMVYILAGTGIADPATAGAIDDTVKAKIAQNAVAFAPEIGRYIDADLAVTQAEIGTILAHMTEDPAAFATPKAQDGLAKMRAGLARTLAGVVTTMKTPGLDPASCTSRCARSAMSGPGRRAAVSTRWCRTSAASPGARASCSRARSRGRNSTRCRRSTT